jgi:protoporphyrinogen oxidase
MVEITRDMNTRDDNGIVILGTGMAGLGAAHQLTQAKVGYQAFDKNEYPGGHTATFISDSGFVFDDGPHISFTSDERLKELFAANVNEEFETPNAAVDNYYQGHRIKHPVQCNLGGLPTELTYACLVDFIAATQTPLPTNFDNYHEWLVATYGATIANTFPAAYGRKFHTVGPERMSTVWLGPRMYRPSLEEVLKGALFEETPDIHYVTDYRYPKQGGFMSFLQPFIDSSKTHLGSRAARIDRATKTIHFANGKHCQYEHLISSVPLPELIAIIDDVPNEVRMAASQLACTTCVAVNIGIDRPDFTDSTWTYFYDEDVIFSRLSFPHKMAPNNCPEGTGSIQVECYYSRKYKPLPSDTSHIAARVIEDLIRTGVIDRSDKILHNETRISEYANIIFDLDREAALPIVHAWLDEIDILYVGRFGEWGYHWTDQAFLSGEQGALKVLDRL